MLQRWFIYNLYADDGFPHFCDGGAYKSRAFRHIINMYVLWNRKDLNMDKAIITVVGKDTVGIIAKICTYLAENKINILDISQTIVQDYFNMMMIVDVSKSGKVFGDIVMDMNTIGEEIGVTIHCQKEEIFTKMHRI